MHYINTFHFLLMCMIIGSTCLLLDLLELTSRQHVLLMVYHITTESLLICGCKLGQDLDKIITFRTINKININTLHDDLAKSDLLIQTKSTIWSLLINTMKH